MPGSLMLMGEHAVLHGEPAVVVAVDHYIHLSLIPRLDRNIVITSSEFGKHQVAIDKFAVTKPYDYLLTAIQQYLKQIPQGFAVKIKSDFPADIGFGSSSAVTVAMLGVLALWLNGKRPSLKSLHQQAVKVIRLVSGVGSGADVAASLFGGVVAYNMDPVKIQKIGTKLPLVAVYSGSKTPTFKVVAAVAKKRKQFPAVLNSLYHAIGCCTKQAIKIIKRGQWSQLGKLINVHQGLQEAMGVSNNILSELVSSLCARKNIYGAKISGSGMGDCVIGLGKTAPNTFPENKSQKKLGVKQIKVKVSTKGIVYESD